MSTVTLKKSEYLKLKKQAAAYRALTGQFFRRVLVDSVEDVVEDFKATGLYSKSFLADLADGLKKSSYFHKK